MCATEGQTDGWTDGKSDIQRWVSHVKTHWTLITTHLKALKVRLNQISKIKTYGRRLCLRLDNVPKQNNEKAEDVFKYLKDLIEEVPDLEILEPVIDRAHDIGPDYTDKKC